MTKRALLCLFFLALFLCTPFRAVAETASDLSVLSSAKRIFSYSGKASAYFYGFSNQTLYSARVIPSAALRTVRTGGVIRAVCHDENSVYAMCESGKGDFFGPLVVASVCLDIAGGNTLVAAGVRDCKSMTDTRILALRELIEETALAYTVLVMKPHVYNIRYGQVQQQGGNLNTLLALGHIAALKQTWQKYPQCRQALVDQFAKNDSIPEGVRAFAPEMQVWQRPRAEEDIAVAAASVLARAAFLQTIEDMGKEAGIGKIPKGGGEAATNAARRLVQKKGTEVWENFVKLHFANTQKI